MTANPTRSTTRPNQVAVVIPAFNAERFVASALESVIAQTVSIAECVVVDDGSTDRTAEVASAIASKGPVRVIRQQNAGVAAARNAGACATSSPLLAFLDADDAWRPERTAKMQSVLERGYDAVVSPSAVTDEQLTPVDSQKTRAVPTAREILLEAEAPVSTSSNLLVTRQAFERVGGFDERLSTSADWALFLALADRCRIGFVDEPLTLYRRHPGNMSRSISLMDHDMRLIYDEVFSGAHPVTPPPRIKRRAFARLHGMLAGSYLDAGQLGRSMSHALRAILWSPAESRRVLGAPLRRVRRLTAPRRR